MAKRAIKPSVDRILDAAESVLATQPYSEISLRTLMAAAQISTTAFYARFDSKEAVVAALTARLFTDLYRGAPGALEIQIVRWAVWNEIDLPTLRAQWTSTARAILPRMEMP